MLTLFFNVLTTGFTYNLFRGISNYYGHIPPIELNPSMVETPETIFSDPKKANNHWRNDIMACMLITVLFQSLVDELT